MNSLLKLNPVLLASFGTLFTWGVTALGSAMVFFFKQINIRILNAMLGFASGVMIAASFWSLLEPSIKMASQIGMAPWLPAVFGFSLGGGFLYLVDKVLPHLHLGLEIEKAEGVKTSLQRSILLVLAVTLHNIPEGFAVGVSFGTLANSPSISTLGSAIALTVGIGLQNFPEGAAISIPLRREGISIGKSFTLGQLSGLVEVIGGILGAYLVAHVKNILPYALAFAAGAMIYVVVEELIPESQQGKETDLSTIGALIGFAIMMFLDVALG